MLTRVRKHLNAATGIAFVALIFAVTGVSFAATGGGSGGLGSNSATVSVGHNTTIATVAKSKPKAKAGPRGPAGAAGKNGATGPAGATGATGPGGPAGAQGPGGPQGPQGPQGEKGAAGTNGTNGTNGTTGFTKTLPSGSTERGVWEILANATAEDEKMYAAVSFPIPLAKALSDEHCAVEVGGKTVSENPCQVHYIGEGEGENEVNANLPVVEGQQVCTGTYEEPRAVKGNLCVFVKESSNAKSFGTLPGVGALHFAAPQVAGNPAINAAGSAGTLIDIASAGAGTVEIVGSWAVTAE